MDLDWAETLARARERLLSTGRLDGDLPLRQDILDSWRRSYDDGADPTQVRPPYHENINLASKLARAAAPVIHRVHEDVKGSPISVILTDSRGKVLIRRCGEQFLEASLDKVLLAPGFSYAERYVGTNGIGTALEDRNAFLVRGQEHFNEALQAYACVGVPLRDPVTSRLLGALDLTTWADLANPALTALVRQAGRVIEEGLLELSGWGAKTLLQEYLHAARDQHARVLAISGDALLAAPNVTRLLGGLNAQELWPLAAEALSGRPRAEVPLLLPSGHQANLHLRSVRRGGEMVGAIIEIEPMPAAEGRRKGKTQEIVPSIPGLAGLSAGVQAAGAALSRAAKARKTAAVVGESGVGKQTTVRAVAAYHFPGRNLVVINAADDLPDTVELVEAVAANVAHGSPVLVRRAELLPAGTVTALMTALAELRCPGEGVPGWLTFCLRVATGAGRSPAEAELLEAGVPLVPVPPLRARTQDLDVLVPAMVQKHAGRRALAPTRPLLTRLAREAWTDNLAEVDELIRDMVRGTPSGAELDVRHLPADRGRGLRRKLTAMEWMTREAIVAALRASDRNKERAAEILGMSRASIYRKVRALDIQPSDLER